jgi:hypothetical protein
MRLIIDVRVPSDWRDDYANLVRSILIENDIDIEKVVVV